jgi:microcompartment protein CcmL/EutN
MTAPFPPRGAPAPLPATGPALGLLETASVARGMVAADVMVKRALVTLVRAHPATPGKFVVLIAGGEEEVEQAMGAGLEVAADTLVDRLYLPKADPQLAPALGGGVQIERVDELDALGIVETFSVAAAILSADRAVKAAAVRLVQLRLARGLGGRAFYVLTGELHQVEAGVEAGRSIIHDGMLLTTEIIARPHVDLLGELLLGGDDRQLDPSRR